MKNYELKMGFYSYDSDSYEEGILTIDFPSLEELKDFYVGFKKLPFVDDPDLIRYFGNYVKMKVFDNYYSSKKNGHFWMDTGGVSTKYIHAFEVTKTEIPLK